MQDASSDSTDTAAHLDAPSPEVVTFFMVGGQRCGSTWVDAALREHPEVFLPKQKQTYFFDRAYDKGIDWYLQNYRGVEPGHRAVGEVATGYGLVHAVPLLHAHFPHVKLIMTMRNPTERAYSYFQSRSTTYGWNRIEEAIEAQPDILERGRYIEQIEALLEHYPRERLLLMFFDDLQADDRGYLRRILEFLGVDPAFESSQFGKVVQMALFPRLRRRLRRLGMQPLMDIVSRSPAGDAIRRYAKRSTVRRYSPMDDRTRSLLREHYRAPNAALASFVGRDLGHWN